MSLFLASKYVVPSHIHLGVFSGFRTISFNKLVNVTWDYERTLRLCQFQVISISRTWSVLPSVQLQLCFPIRVPFFSPHFPFQNLSVLSLGGVSFTITWFFPIFLWNFLASIWKILFGLKICYVYQIIFPSVLLLVFFALVPL